MKIFDLISEYQKNFPIYQQFIKEIQSLLAGMLADHQIGYSQIESRIKSLPAFLDKAYRLISGNEQFYFRFNDLIGIRVITFYSTDVDRIAALIENKFKIHAKNFEYESHNRSPDQFGYASKHYKVSLADEEIKTGKLTQFKDIIFEVQIRTIVQHAWATIDHKIRYKSAAKLPNDIQREIFQLNALFELADNQFLTIKKKLEAEDQKELQKYKNGDFSAKINAATLEHFFQKKQTLLNSIADQAQEIGYKKIADQYDVNCIRYLLVVFQRVGINTIGELEKLFKRIENDGRDVMNKIFQVISDHSSSAVDYPFPILLLLIITLRLQTIKFNDLDADQLVPKVLTSSLKSISLSLGSRKP